MRAIPVNEETLERLKPEVSRHLFRQLKDNLISARERKVRLYYIPEYAFPEAAGIPREHIVDDAFLYRYFEVGSAREDMVWIHIRPKYEFTMNRQSLEELPCQLSAIPKKRKTS